MNTGMEMYLSEVGLSYEDPKWVKMRRHDLTQYLLKYPNTGQTVDSIMSSEKDSILSEYSKAIINGQGIEIEFKDTALYLDTSISHGYGHSRIGLSKGKVIKIIRDVHITPLAISRIELVQTISELCVFVKKAIQLHSALPNVVKYYPTIIVRRLWKQPGQRKQVGQGKQANQRKEADQRKIIGYEYSVVMSLAPGLPLCDVWRQLDPKEFTLVVEGIMNTIEGMATYGYGFSDFAMDNIMYDSLTGKHTIIDIKPSDFGRNDRFLSDSIWSIYSQLYEAIRQNADLKK
jgi:hypothetical protein